MGSRGTGFGVVDELLQSVIGARASHTRATPTPLVAGLRKLTYSKRKTVQAVYMGPKSVRPANIHTEYNANLRNLKSIKFK